MTHFLTGAGNLILKATANNTKPTPGYLLSEIEKRSFIGMDECELLEKCLRWQVRHQSWKIKYKALCVIKRLATRGNADFKRLMKIDVNDIKQCQAFQGRPDPVLGDEPSRRVRAAAKSALAALLAEGNSRRAASKSKMTGFGSSAPPTNTSPKNSIIAALEKGAKAVGGAVVKGAKFVGEHAKRAGEDISGKNLGSIRSNSSRPTSNTPGWNMASNRGGGAQQQQQQYGAPQPNMSTATGAWGTSADSGRPPAPAPVQTANRAATDGRYERSLVKELLSQGGMRPVPPQQSVTRFVQKCRSLDPTTMATILNEQLSHNSWQHRNKTLVTVEALLQDPSCRGIALVFKKSHISIAAQARHPKPTIQKKAARVMALISRIAAPPPAPAPAPEPETSGGFDFVAGEDDDDGDMFGGMEMEGGGDEGAAGGGGFDFIESGDGGGDDMFNDMNVVGPEPPAPAPATGGFDFLGGGNAAPAPAPTPAGNDDLLNMYGAATPAPSASSSTDIFGGMMGGAAPQPAPAPAAFGGSGDLLGGLTGFGASAPAPAPASSGGDFLAGLDFGNSAPAPATTPMGGMAESPRSNGIYSAFDSLNLGSTPMAQMPGHSSFSKYNAPAPAHMNASKAPAPTPAPVRSNASGGGGAGGSDAFSFIQAAMNK